MKMSDVFELPLNDFGLWWAAPHGTVKTHDDMWNAAAHAINQHDRLVEAVRLFLAYNDATDDDDDVAMMLMYADALRAAKEAIACESE